MSKPTPKLPPSREKVIRDGEAYLLDEFRARVGWGVAAWRTARRNGLQSYKAGGRTYVAGADFIEWLTKRDSNDGDA
jgi:hypothetical protein